MKLSNMKLAWNLQQVKNLLSSWVLVISARMVYYHQSSVMFMRVWRCFIRIVRLYLRYCILAVSILFCYGICDSIICIISVLIFLVTVKFIVLCVSTLSLWIEFIFLLWILIDSFVWIAIVHSILFDISGWYHCVWCILHTSKVIKGNACVYCQDQLVLPVLLFYQWA